MEFSWQYTQSIRSVVKPTFSPSIGSIRFDNGCPILLICDVDRTRVSEVPACAANAVLNQLLRVREDSFRSVFPVVLPEEEVCVSGADSILRTFSRFRSRGGRVIRLRTSKGEIYYGSPGIILDEDFNPLLLSTYKVGVDEHEGPSLGGTTVYLSPSVFTDDSKSLNKALARKALPYLLLNDISYYGPVERATVKIDDCSSFNCKETKNI